MSNSYQTHAAVAHPRVKLYLFVLISLPLFHAPTACATSSTIWACAPAGASWPCSLYGAILGTIATAYVLLTVP